MINIQNYINSQFVNPIQDNWIEGNGVGIGESDCGVELEYSDYCEISGNTFWWNAVNSISLWNSDVCNVFNNYINGSFTHGIWVDSSHNTTIEENEIYNSEGTSGPSCGIFMEDSHNASLIHNILGHNSENGITIVFSDDGEIIGNIIYDSEYNGLFIDASSFWTVYDNVIYDNGAPGIYLDGGADNITLYQNDIGWSGEFLVHDSGSDNVWNYTGIGNWYSDYDGIGPYDPNGGPSLDHHPSRSLYCGATDPSEYEAGTTGNMCRVS